MNLMQLEWIKKEIKCESYEFSKFLRVSTISFTPKMSLRDLIVSSTDIFIKSKGPSAISIELGRVRVHYNEAKGLYANWASRRGIAPCEPSDRLHTARINSNLNLTGTRYGAQDLRSMVGIGHDYDLIPLSRAWSEVPQRSRWNGSRHYIGAVRLWPHDPRSSSSFFPSLIWTIQEEIDSPRTSSISGHGTPAAS
jgi:hypothetical protein